VRQNFVTPNPRTAAGFFLVNMLKGTAICALACSAAAFTPSAIPLRITHRSSVAPLHSVAQSDSPTQPRRQFLLQVGSVATALSSVCVSPALALSPPADAPVGTEDDPYSPASIDKQVGLRFTSSFEVQQKMK
jgi:hypothetical protein